MAPVTRNILGSSLFKDGSEYDVPFCDCFGCRHFSDKLKKATKFGLSVFTGWYKIALLPNLQQNRKNALDTSPKHGHIKRKKKALIKSFIYKK